MPTKQLMGVWIFLDICLLVAGVVSIVFSQLFAMPDLVLNFTISKADLTAGLIMGIFLVLTWVLSIGAIVQPNHSTLGLKILNLALVADAVVVTAIGSFVWFYSLQQRNNYYEVFKSVPDSTKLALQNQFSCCGYFLGNDTLTVGGFCADPVFAANNATPCVGPITAATDYTLNNIFSSVYGFGAVVTALFVASLCVINMRVEEERFKKIDSKRGGRGFA